MRQMYLVLKNEGCFEEFSLLANSPPLFLLCTLLYEMMMNEKIKATLPSPVLFSLHFFSPSTADETVTAQCNSIRSSSRSNSSSSSKITTTAEQQLAAATSIQQQQHTAATVAELQQRPPSLQSVNYSSTTPELDQHLHV